MDFPKPLISRSTVGSSFLFHQLHNRHRACFTSAQSTVLLQFIFSSLAELCPASVAFGSTARQTDPRPSPLGPGPDHESHSLLPRNRKSGIMSQADSSSSRAKFQFGGYANLCKSIISVPPFAPSTSPFPLSVPLFPWRSDGGHACLLTSDSDLNQGSVPMQCFCTQRLGMVREEWGE